MSKVQKGQSFELEVTNLAFGGKGLGRLDDFVVFVEGAIPGDTVLVQATTVKKRYAEAQIEQLLVASPFRRSPRCTVFGRCGGCVWQNLDYNVQLKYKAAQVRESLERLGGLHGFDQRPILGMADPWRYRNRADFAVGESEQGPVVGFRPRGRWDTVLPLDECHLLHPAIEEIRRLVQQWLREQGLPGWNPRERSGLVRQVLVRVAQQGKQSLVSVVTSAMQSHGTNGRDKANAGRAIAPGDLPGAAELVARLTYECPHVVGVLHAVNGGPAELSSGLPSALLWGRPFLREKVAGIELEISVDAFFQTNTLMAHLLYGLAAQEATAALAACGPEGPRTEPPVVWDLYCGVGSIGLAVARNASAVLGVESSVSAVGDAQRNALLNGFSNMHFVAGDVAKLLSEVSRGVRSLPGEVAQPSVIIVDPPRSGLSKKAVKRISDIRAPRLVYVSCNPTTMAANLAQFAETGYRLVRVTPVDMFPHTPHVEAVALLTLG